jgi:4-amino-4-deoxy-L-arabinose transferase-like glycosyltransferase
MYAKLERITRPLPAALKDKKLWALLVILGIGAYLRLWNLEHLFNAIHDYDEGVYTLGARFITEGQLPYRDFILAHPPLYSLILAAIYKIFGYNFFFAKYLSVALSLACIPLLYLVGKKMYRPGVGLAAAAIFAVSPEIVYFGRRCVQESLGLFLIILALYFVFDYLDSKKNSRLLFCGILLGLTVATKYIFIPAVIAIIAATLFSSMGERFRQSIKTLGRPAFWVMYL